jgi:septum formation protein
VIGCDTVAHLCGEILGKPTDRADAKRMLRCLSGRRHSVWSGLCLIDTATGSISCDQAESQLDMKKLSEQELTAYLDSGDWQGKSGAFGYQDGHTWLSLISGTAENVVGLPIDVLEKLLAKQLIKPN